MLLLVFLISQEASLHTAAQNAHYEVLYDCRLLQFDGLTAGNRIHNVNHIGLGKLASLSNVALKLVELVLHDQIQGLRLTALARRIRKEASGVHLFLGDRLI